MIANFLFPDVNITENNLPDLVNVLNQISNKWRDIGIQLKVKQQALDDIENNTDLVREGSYGFLRGTLNLMEQPTIKTLSSALRTMKEDDIAQSIEEFTAKGQQI